MQGNSDILLVLGGEAIRETKGETKGGKGGKRQAVNSMLSYDPE